VSALHPPAHLDHLSNGVLAVRVLEIRALYILFCVYHYRIRNQTSKPFSECAHEPPDYIGRACTWVTERDPLYFGEISLGDLTVTIFDPPVIGHHQGVAVSSVFYLSVCHNCDYASNIRTYKHARLLSILNSSKSLDIADFFGFFQILFRIFSGFFWGSP